MLTIKGVRVGSWFGLCGLALAAAACGDDTLPRFARPPGIDAGARDAGIDSGARPSRDSGEDPSDADGGAD
jgi:hypothetical protein